MARPLCVHKAAKELLICFLHTAKTFTCVYYGWAMCSAHLEETDFCNAMMRADAAVTSAHRGS